MARRAGLRLDPDGVIDAALQVIDSEGFAQLSLSAVAALLGVRPSALYTHVGGADDLHHVVAVRATVNLTTAVRNAAVGVGGKDAVIAVAMAYRTFAREHPGQYTASVAPPDADDARLGEATAELQHLFTQVLVGCNLSGAAADQAATVVRSALHGFAALEAVDAHHVDPDHFDRMVATLVNGLLPG